MHPPIDLTFKNAVNHYLTSLYPDIRIPDERYSDYYLAQLRKSAEYDGMGDQIWNIKEMLEFKGEDTEFGPRVSKYKKEMLGNFIKLFNETGWVKQLNDIPLNDKLSLQGMTPDYRDGYYISIDIVSANFSVFNHFVNLGSHTWNAFAEKQLPQMFKALRDSKSFRQLLFGNLNPRRIQALTSRITASNLAIIEETYPKLVEFVVGVSHDEIVLKLNSYNHLNDVLGLLNTLSWGPVPLKFRAFKTKSIPGEGKAAHIRSEFKVTDNSSVEPEETIWYNKLRGIAGNRFYLLYKRHILNEPVEVLDRILVIDGHTAMWQD